MIILKNQTRNAAPKYIGFAQNNYADEPVFGCLLMLKG